MKCLVDTNVIIDALTSREPWNKSAEKIFLMGANRFVDLYITASSATDIYYLIRKYMKDTDKAKQVMSKLFVLFNILDVKGTDCIDALASPIVDYEDAVLENVASKNQLDYIVTRNIKDYQNGSVKTLLPDDFIRLLEEKK